MLIAFCLCSYGQNKVKYAYDEAGNMTKRQSALITTEKAGDYLVKVYPSPTKGPVEVKVYDKNGNLFTGSVVISVVNLATSSVVIYKKPYSGGIIKFDITSSPDGIYGMNVVINPDQSNMVSSQTIKIIKQA